MKNNPESGEFCCVHICLFNKKQWKSNSFSDDLDAPASSFSLVLFVVCKYFPSGQVKDFDV